jgi:hypothetical protein
LEDLDVDGRRTWKEDGEKNSDNFRKLCRIQNFVRSALDLATGACPELD